MKKASRISVFIFILINIITLIAFGDVDDNKKIVFLRLNTCCSDIAWPQAEESFIEELKTLNASIKTVESEEPFIENGSHQFNILKKQQEIDALVRIWITPENKLQLDIISGHDENNNTRKLIFENSHTPEVLENMLLSGIEAVRAAMIKIELPKKEEPAPENNPKPNKIESSIKNLPLMGVAIGSGTSWSPGGIGPATGFAWSLTLKPLAFMLLETDGQWAMLSKNINSSSGKVSFDTLMIRGFIYGTIFNNRPVNLALGAGAGLAVVWIKNSSLKGDSDNVAYLGLASRLLFKISPLIGIILSFKTGILLPSVELFLDDSSLAKWGRPVIDGAILLQFSF
ncbi:MAG: hypothetical protein JXR91_17535 [Deltaproteobacteria bacterium]|nr:hypothetical protein [Deltaproteobacteria bacterium]